jgi:hypothetical protein
MAAPSVGSDAFGRASCEDVWNHLWGDSQMDYRAYLLDEEGHIVDAHIFVAASDGSGPCSCVSIRERPRCGNLAAFAAHRSNTSRAEVYWSRAVRGRFNPMAICAECGVPRHQREIGGKSSKENLGEIVRA